MVCLAWPLVEGRNAELRLFGRAFERERRRAATGDNLRDALEVAGAADRQRLKKVLLNLLSNGVKYNRD